MVMYFTGRHADGEGQYDIVQCSECGLARTEEKGVNPSKLKCKNCKELEK